MGRYVLRDSVARLIVLAAEQVGLDDPDVRAAYEALSVRERVLWTDRLAQVRLHEAEADRRHRAVYRATHPERVRAWKRTYEARHPEQVRAQRRRHEARRRARVRAAQRAEKVQ